jgi:methyl-accepting chemotaxis protein
MNALMKITGAVKRHLTLKMLAALAVYFILMTAVFATLLYQFNRLAVNARKTAVKEMWSLFRSELATSSDLKIALEVGQAPLVEPLLQKLKDYSKLRYVVIYGREGALGKDGSRLTPLTAYFRDDLGCDPELPLCADGDTSCGRVLPCSEQNLSCYCENFPALADQENAAGVEFRRFSVPIIEFSLPIAAVSPDGLGQSSKDKSGWVRAGFSLDTSEFSSILRNILIATLTAMIILAAAITYALHRMIALPISQMGQTARLIGRGELTAKVAISSEDEIGQLGQAFNEMTDNLSTSIARNNSIIANISDTVDHISNSTTDMFSISAQQSSGATEQAASVYEASSTSKEIAASASRIAETAEEVATFARETNAATGRGKDELGLAIGRVRAVTERTEEVAHRMVELGARSQKISGIIDIIKEISEQTNLLALNAAIEAAGAGEAGRRFAVVAQEIRRLAGRTLDATQTVREIIEEIQSSTNTTVMVTEQSMTVARESQAIIENMNLTFQNILDMVDKTLNASTQINLSTRQQTTACEQMVATIMEVSDVAGEVERGAKESESALSRLRELSDTLKQLAESAEHQDQR